MAPLLFACKQGGVASLRQHPSDQTESKLWWGKSRDWKIHQKWSKLSEGTNQNQHVNPFPAAVWQVGLTKGKATDEAGPAQWSWPVEDLAQVNKARYCPLNKPKGDWQLGKGGSTPPVQIVS